MSVTTEVKNELKPESRKSSPQKSSCLLSVQGHSSFRVPWSKLSAFSYFRNADNNNGNNLDNKIVVKPPDDKPFSDQHLQYFLQCVESLIIPPTIPSNPETWNGILNVQEFIIGADESNVINKEKMVSYLMNLHEFDQSQSLYLIKRVKHELMIESILKYNEIQTRRVSLRFRSDVLCKLLQNPAKIDVNVLNIESCNYLFQSMFDMYSIYGYTDDAGAWKRCKKLEIDFSKNNSIKFRFKKFYNNCEAIYKLLFDKIQHWKFAEMVVINVFNSLIRCILEEECRRLVFRCDHYELSLLKYLIVETKIDLFNKKYEICSNVITFKNMVIAEILLRVRSTMGIFDVDKLFWDVMDKGLSQSEWEEVLMVVLKECHSCLSNMILICTQSNVSLTTFNSNVNNACNGLKIWFGLFKKCLENCSVEFVGNDTNWFDNWNDQTYWCAVYSAIFKNFRCDLEKNCNDNKQIENVFSEEKIDELFAIKSMEPDENAKFIISIAAKFDKKRAENFAFYLVNYQLYVPEKNFSQCLNESWKTKLQAKYVEFVNKNGVPWDWMPQF